MDKPQEYSDVEKAATRVIATFTLTLESQLVSGPAHEYRYNVLENGDVLLGLRASELTDMIQRAMLFVLDALPEDKRPDVEWFINGAQHLSERMMSGPFGTGVRVSNPESAPITEEEIEKFMKTLFPDGEKDA